MVHPPPPEMLETIFRTVKEIMQCDLRALTPSVAWPEAF